MQDVDFLKNGPKQTSLHRQLPGALEDKKQSVTLDHSKNGVKWRGVNGSQSPPPPI